MTTYSTNACVTLPAPKASLWSRLFNMMATQRQRSQLCGLTSEQLKDIGLTHQDVARETTKPFWDVPNHWKS